MKKILLTLFLGCSFSALARTESYYFSDKLKEAVSTCTPYTEELIKNNPDMPTAAEQAFLIVKGKRKNECEITLKYIFGEGLIQDYICFLPRKGQDQLLAAMNDKSSAQIEKRTFRGGTSATDSRFNLTITEIMMEFCKLPE